MRARKTLIAMPIALALLASCSIKEDRSPCPCWLQVDLSDAHIVRHISLWTDKLLYEEDPLDTGNMEVEPFRNVEQEIVLNSATKAVNIPAVPSATLREFKVPRGMVTVSAICATSSPINSGRIEIPLGHQADELYGHLEKTHARDPSRQSLSDPRQFFNFDPDKVLAGGVIFISGYLLFL